MALTDWHQKLLKKRILDIRGEVNYDMMSYVREALLTLLVESAPRAILSIASGGGKSQAGWDIYDLLQSYPGEIVGFVNPHAGSSAAIILQGCHWRVATPNSRVLIHHMTVTDLPVPVIRDPTRLQKYLEASDHLWAGYHTLAKRVGKTFDEFYAKCDENEYMPAKAALEFGLLDQIVTKLDEIKLLSDSSGPA
jgi:ATP-dependent Clp protease protease subunit